jgi:hypothetical protein
MPIFWFNFLSKENRRKEQFTKSILNYGTGKKKKKD